MAKLSYKVSYYVFYVCVALILVVLGMFYGVGYGETNVAGQVEPANTPALMYLMYGMFAVTVIVTLIGAIAQFGGALKDNPKGAIKSLLGLILLIVLLVVTYNIGSSEPVVQGGGEVYSDTMWLKITDMFLYSTYVLAVIAAVGTLVNMSGIFKK
mgnify:FL=1|uniref:hypothetical protein n=1 Tax=Phocaeicola coprophilus TaxID=387090 RepID=UPI002795BDD8|nr:hypothetical protein [Phocaeicola coprophilus]